MKKLFFLLICMIFSNSALSDTAVVSSDLLPNSSSIEIEIEKYINDMEMRAQEIENAKKFQGKKKSADQMENERNKAESRRSCSKNSPIGAGKDLALFIVIATNVQKKISYVHNRFTSQVTNFEESGKEYEPVKVEVKFLLDFYNTKIAGKCFVNLSQYFNMANKTANKTFAMHDTYIFDINSAIEKFNSEVSKEK